MSHPDLHDGTISCVRNHVPEPPVSARPEPPAPLQLARFLPFRLNRLAVGVSDYLSAIYRQRFGLDIPEWRVIATVGPERGCTAQHIADSTRMHKTRVSRAIAELERRGIIERILNARDRRERELRLTRAGRRMYAELVPLALERERELLTCLSAAQIECLNEGIGRLEEFLRLL